VGLIDLFDKLITERGSAAIQEKHIALLREQFTILEKMSVELESKNVALASEKSDLEFEKVALGMRIKELEAEVQRLNHEIQRRDNAINKEIHHEQSLQESSERILIKITEGTTMQDGLASALGMSEQALLAQIELPIMQSLIERQHGMFIELTPAGRAYLLKRGLLK
jgi:hypothetical protein